MTELESAIETLRYAAQSRLVTPGTYPKIMCIVPHVPLTAPGERRAELTSAE